MSWSYSIQPTPGPDFDAAADAAFEAAKPTIEQNNAAGMDAAAEAKEIAKRLVKSGVLGDTTRRYGANLNGHGNTDHTPEGRYVNDTISIHVFQATEPA